MWTKRPWPCPSYIFIHFTLLAVCWAQSTDYPTEPETTTTNIPPLFLRPGLSYHGKTASTRIANIAATVAVLVSIDNWTRFPLIEPKTHLKCGKILGDVPSTIHPGTSEMVVFEKGPGFTGVCAVLTYLLEMPPELEYDYSEEPNENKPSYVQVMMSVPYNLNSYHAYLAVGIDNMYLNSTGIFDQIYYYTGPFERAQAGSLVEYTSEDGKVMIRGTMTPDTYKPVLQVSVIPTDKKTDGFHMYSSQCRLTINNKWTLYALLPCVTLIYTQLSKIL